MNHFLSNYKTSLPAVVLILGLLILFIALFAKVIDAAGFSVCAASLTGVCTFLIGLGAKDADR
jgi:putative effector of murein hydrolase LrgA (UPF0299 family)